MKLYIQAISNIAMTEDEFSELCDREMDRAMTAFYDGEVKEPLFKEKNKYSSDLEREMSEIYEELEEKREEFYVREPEWFL